MQKNRKAFPSDSTDIEWELIVPYLPSACPTGRPQKWEWRDIVGALFYISRNGCAWRALPGDFPPWQSVYRYFVWFKHSRLWQLLNDHISQEVRLEEGREAGPSAGSIDSQSVKASDTGCFHGFDAGKNIKGIKRHILVDTNGFLLTAVGHSAGDQDYDASKWVFEKFANSQRNTRFALCWADAIYNKDRVREAAAHLVKRGETPLVLEAGSAVGNNIRQWGHVRVFSPWKYNIDTVAATLLKETGWQAPEGEYLPTGLEFVEQYLEPLAALPQLKGSIRLNSNVVAVTRLGFDKIKTTGRESASF